MDLTAAGNAQGSLPGPTSSWHKDFWAGASPRPFSPSVTSDVILDTVRSEVSLAQI